jgi:hypothetical protein
VVRVWLVLHEKVCAGLDEAHRAEGEINREHVLLPIDDASYCFVAANFRYR